MRFEPGSLPADECLGAAGERAAERSATAALVLPLVLAAAPVASATTPGTVSFFQAAGSVHAEAGTFVDATVAAGIDFTHVSGAFGDKWFPETNGAGVSFFDADGDGWQDVLFVQGMPWPGHEEAVPEELRGATMKLYRNTADGRFADVTAAAGLNVQTYGVAGVPGDFDNDGDADLYVTAYGPNHLFRNEGGGRFVEVTETAGVGHPGWSTSAAWIDYDRDGDLDLYVCNYLRWSPGIHLYCSIDGSTRSYCNPKAFEGEPSVLYRNEGDGRFTDVSKPAGVWAAGGKSLGVTVADFNRDGWPDLAVANDTEPNYLFENQQDGSFHEVGMMAGMAVDSGGMARAGMGIDTADYRNDDRISVAIGNFSNEMIGLFEPTGNGVFVDVAGRSGLGHSSFLPLTFALFFFDYDLDGWLDMLAINGHIYEQVREVEPDNSYLQLPLLYHNDGDGRLTDVAAEVGGPLAVKIAGRGGAYADFDRDGDLDVAVSTKEGPGYLWRNTRRDTGAPPHVVRLRLRGTTSNHDAIGAAVTVSSGGWRQIQLVKSGSSYASQSELALTFGLGARDTVDSIDILWPRGARSRIEGAALAGLVDHEVVVVEGRGITERLALSGAGVPSPAAAPRTPTAKRSGDDR